MTPRANFQSSQTLTIHRFDTTPRLHSRYHTLSSLVALANARHTGHYFVYRRQIFGARAIGPRPAGSREYTACFSTDGATCGGRGRHERNEAISLVRPHLRHRRNNKQRIDLSLQRNEIDTMHESVRGM